MGTFPAFNWSMRFSSISVQCTSWPAAARQAPVTSPTYPHPITVSCTIVSPLFAIDFRPLETEGARMEPQYLIDSIRPAIYAPVTAHAARAGPVVVVAEPHSTTGASIRRG